MTRPNILFMLACAILLSHLLPVPIHLDGYSLGLLGMMFGYCLLEQWQVRHISAKVSREGVEASLSDTAPEPERPVDNVVHMS